MVKRLGSREGVETVGTSFTYIQHVNVDAMLSHTMTHLSGTTLQGTSGKVLLYTFYGRKNRPSKHVYRLDHPKLNALLSVTLPLKLGWAG